MDKTTRDIAVHLVPVLSLSLLLLVACSILFRSETAFFYRTSDSGWSINDASLKSTVAAEDETSATAQPQVLDARQVYLNNCAVCHGPAGQGDGTAAYLLFPKPRNFTSGVFRFKSTPQDQPPTQADVVRNITNGIARTAMPAFGGVLQQSEIDALADYVLSLNQGTTRDVKAVPITIPAQPEFTPSLVQDGQRIYQTMGCAQCHGESGRGDGPSSWDLSGADGYPLPPADFSTGVYKAGRLPEDLYRTIMVGVPGTPMPSFDAALQAGITVDGIDSGVDMVWAMVAFLESLQVDREPTGIASGATIIPGELRGDLMLNNPFDRGWNAIDATYLGVQPLWQRKWSLRSVELRAAQNNQQIAFCIEWPDPTFDAVEGVDRATDATALMFSLTEGVPFLTMGGANADGNDMLVNIWQWKASRQLDADTGERHDIPIDVAGAPADYYPFKSGDAVMGPLTEHDSTFVPAWSVGNLNGDPARIGNPMIESNAAGFGTLTQQPAEQQSVRGAARWSNGVWRVIFVRDLKSTYEGDVQLAPGGSQRVPFALAVWQGSALDRNGTKLVSGWHFLQLNSTNW